MCIVLVIYHFLTHIGEVVFIKMPSRQQQRRAKRRAEYLQNRNEELETSLGFGASKRGRDTPPLRSAEFCSSQHSAHHSIHARRVCCDEQNSDELRASKRQKQQETNRDSKRIQYWINPSAACLAKRAQYQKRKREAQR